MDNKYMEHSMVHRRNRIHVESHLAQND